MKENNPNAVTKSAVHKADFVGNKWNIGLMGFNDTTGGNCIFCYSHSSYFAELPERFLKNDKGQYIDLKGNVVAKNNKIENEYLKEFDKIWSYENNNLSLPILVMPKDKGEEK